jgi:hypothetical protein
MDDLEFEQECLLSLREICQLVDYCVRSCDRNNGWQRQQPLFASYRFFYAEAIIKKWPYLIFLMIAFNRLLSRNEVPL